MEKKPKKKNQHTADFAPEQVPLPYAEGKMQPAPEQANFRVQRKLRQNNRHKAVFNILPPSCYHKKIFSNIGFRIHDILGYINQSS